MADRMTKRDLFEGLLALGEVQGNPEFVAGLKHELELLDRKVSRSKRESKVTPEIVETAFTAIAENNGAVTIKEIIASDPMFDGYTSQKMVPVLRKLIDAGRVEKFYEKRVAMFKVVD